LVLLFGGVEEERKRMSERVERERKGREEKRNREKRMERARARRGEEAAKEKAEVERRESRRSWKRKEEREDVEKGGRRGGNEGIKGIDERRSGSRLVACHLFPLLIFWGERGKKREEKKKMKGEVEVEKDGRK